MAVNKCIKYLLFFFNLLFWVSLQSDQREDVEMLSL